ncbi:MAG TPA: DNRLRE domain-containing protein [Herpetosiphonaceae bacterium]
MATRLRATASGAGSRQRRVLSAALLITAVALVSLGPLLFRNMRAGAGDLQPSLPLRAAFYYPWFPEAWAQRGIEPYTKFTPALGYYNSSDPTVIQQHIAAMQYGHIAAGIASWWGPGTPTDQRLPLLLAAAAGSPFRWAVYYEAESLGNPDVATLQADLAYLRERYGTDPSYLRIDDRFVVFVYADPGDRCDMVERWRQANTAGAYVVLKVFEGYRRCGAQPDGWHQYAPAVPEDGQGHYSYSISPGFDKAGEQVRLGRDLARWERSVQAMVASGSQFQLVTTFNEWGEGTAVEAATEWTSPSGFGAFLDVLHAHPLAAPSAAPSSVPTATAEPTIAEPPPPTATAEPTIAEPPPPTATATAIITPTATFLPTATPTSTSSITLTFAVEADASVDLGHPRTNYGKAPTLRVDGGGTPEETYLQFSARGLTGVVRRATLRLMASSSTRDGPGVELAENAWTEAGITWDNRPLTQGAPVDRKGVIRSGTWVEYDVTPLVTGDATYTFKLAPTSDDGVSFYAREHSLPGRAPQLVVIVVGAGEPPTPEPTAILPPTQTPPPGGDPVLVGAGDIADCDSAGDEATAALLDAIPGTVFTTGDNAYDDGASAEFAQCYGASWGRHKERTRPAIGNHEYLTANARPYFDYFGAAAGEPGRGYYTYPLGNWRVFVLNTNCDRLGGCGPDTAQYQWLEAELTAAGASCVIAYFHHPRWSSGKYQVNESVRPLYQLMYQHGVELVVAGHAHSYERFAPMTPDGELDLARGVRQIVVGTGGKNHIDVDVNHLPNSEVRNDDTFGVLKVVLHEASYEWQFIPEAGKSFTDSGAAGCH